jgi:hypothetical protein
MLSDVKFKYIQHPSIRRNSNKCPGCEPSDPSRINTHRNNTQILSLPLVRYRNDIIKRGNFYLNFSSVSYHLFETPFNNSSFSRPGAPSIPPHPLFSCGKRDVVGELEEGVNSKHHRDLTGPTHHNIVWSRRPIFSRRIGNHGTNLIISGIRHQ